MIPPPKYTRTAQEGSFDQNHHHNNFIDDESSEIDAPPPAYSRQSNWATSRPDVQSASEEGSISGDRPIVRLPPISSHLQQVYPPASHRAASRRGNPFVEDVRAWNAFRVVNLNNNSSRGTRVGNSRSAPRHGYRSRDDVENDGFHGRPLRSPKYRCEFDLCLPHSS